jgi:hypothetical protein
MHFWAIMANPKIYIASSLFVVLGILLVIERTRVWIVRRFKTLDYISDYLKAAIGHFGDVFWGVAVGAGIGSLLGVTLPFLILALYSQFQTPPRFVNWLAILCAVILAGYYVWRADHVRLMPKFEINKFCTQHTPTMDRNTGEPTGASMWVQLVPRCLTEAEVVDCQGHLKQVRKWSNGSGWEETEMNETLELFWSHGGDVPTPITLHPGIERRLNVFFIHTSNGLITPVVHPTPLRAIGVFSPQGKGPQVFRFDIKVTAKDCPDVDLSLQVQLTNDPFNPLIEIVKEQNEN